MERTGKGTYIWEKENEGLDNFQFSFLLELVFRQFSELFLVFLQRDSPSTIVRIAFSCGNEALCDTMPKKTAQQRSKLTFSKSRLLATFNCKMVAIKQNSVAKKRLNEWTLYVILHEGLMRRRARFNTSLCYSKRKRKKRLSSSKNDLFQHYKAAETG